MARTLASVPGRCSVSHYASLQGQKRLVLSESCSRDSVSSQPSCTVLNYSYGVNAWKSWVQAKYAAGETSKGEELHFGRKCHVWMEWRGRSIPEAGSQRADMLLTLSEAAVLVSAAKPMRIKEDILACTAAELNYGLAQFVKEITRPNGERYEPDSIYYLCLGIQQVREGLLPSGSPQSDPGVRSGEVSFILLSRDPERLTGLSVSASPQDSSLPGSVFVPKSSGSGGSCSPALHPSCTSLRRAGTTPQTQALLQHQVCFVTSWGFPCSSQKWLVLGVCSAALVIQGEGFFMCALGCLGRVCIPGAAVSLLTVCSVLSSTCSRTIVW